jgi:uncharacterized protein YbjT (DUF2867 family)
MTHTVLVTGATGTVGGALLGELAERRESAGADPDAGETVRVRGATRAPPGEGPAEEWTEFDFGRPETWGRTLEDVDRLFLVWPPGVVGVDPVRSFVDAAERTGVDRIVFLSTLGADRLPVLPHRRIERHLERSGPAHTFLRASFFMQNFSEVNREEIARRGELFVPAGDGATSFVDARDVAAVGAAALLEDGHAGRAYEPTGPTALTYEAAAAVFSETLDRPVSYPRPSLLTFARERLRAGDDLGFVVAMCGIYTTARLGLAARTTDDVERVLGRPPRDLRTFVADHADLFRSTDDRTAETAEA